MCPVCVPAPPGDSLPVRFLSPPEEVLCAPPCLGAVPGAFGSERCMVRTLDRLLAPHITDPDFLERLRSAEERDARLRQGEQPATRASSITETSNATSGYLRPRERSFEQSSVDALQGMLAVANDTSWAVGTFAREGDESHTNSMGSNILEARDIDVRRAMEARKKAEARREAEARKEIEARFAEIRGQSTSVTTRTRGILDRVQDVHRVLDAARATAVKAAPLGASVDRSTTRQNAERLEKAGSQKDAFNAVRRDLQLRERRKASKEDSFKRHASFKAGGPARSKSSRSTTNDEAAFKGAPKDMGNKGAYNNKLKGAIMIDYLSRAS